jgi:hypothetical protein
VITRACRGRWASCIFQTQCLQLEPDLLVVDERNVGRRVHRALAHDEAIGEPFEHAREQVLHRAVHEPLVRVRRLGEGARGHAGVADLAT